MTIDGLFSDWQTIDPLYSDLQGDGNGMVDFGRVWMTNDDRFVYLSFEVTGDVSLQSGSGIVIGLDTDFDHSTGSPFESIGAELVWDFGERIGSFQSGGQSVDVAFQDIGLVTAPTVSSSVFELSFKLDAEPRRLGRLFPSDTVRLTLSHADAGDRLPDFGAEAVFTIDRTVEERVFDVRIDRDTPSDFRILSWNVEQDGLFESNRTNAYTRILKAVAPDAIVFSEIFSHSAAETLDRINHLSPPNAGSQWFSSAAQSSVVVVSKTPIIETFEMEQNGRARGFLIGRPPGFDADVLVVGMHLFCCEADVRRQLQVDQIMASIRDARLEGRIPALTPIVLAGDMNFVGDRRQPATLIEGTIINPSQQPSFGPDWDGSSFTDALPSTTGLPQTFTWISPRAAADRQFAPGRLDYIIFSDAVMSKGNAYALYTPEISFSEREQLGLNATDSGVASDHLPLVADFSASAPVANEVPPPPGGDRVSLDVYPNPASADISIELDGIPFSEPTLEILDALGRRVQLGRLTIGGDGSSRHLANVRQLPAGFYLVRVRSGGRILSKGFVKRHVTN